MSGLNLSMLAICAALALAGVGWLALQASRTGFDYSNARGNPRNRGAAHESLWDIGKGAVLIIGAPALAAFIFRTVTFS